MTRDHKTEKRYWEGSALQSYFMQGLKGKWFLDFFCVFFLSINFAGYLWGVGVEYKGRGEDIITKRSLNQALYIVYPIEYIVWR